MPAPFWLARLTVVWENQFFLRSFCAVYIQPNYFELSVFPVSKVLPLALLMVVMTQLSLQAFSIAAILVLAAVASLIQLLHIVACQCMCVATTVVSH